MSAYRQISRLQLFVLIAIVSMGMTSLRFPAYLIEHTGRHAWLIVLLAFGVGCIHMMIASQLSKLHPGAALPDIARRCFGKAFGGMYTAAVFAVCLVWAVELFWEYWAFLSYTQLHQTPVTIASVLFMAVILYLLRSGLEAWARLCQILALLLIVLLPLMDVPQLINADIRQLLPLWDIPWSGLLHPFSLQALVIFKSAALLLFLLPHVGGRPVGMRLPLAALGVGFVQMLFSITLPIIILGPQCAAAFTFPFPETMETMPLFFLPIEKTSVIAPLFFLLLLVVNMLCVLNMCSQCLRSLLVVFKERTLQSWLAVAVAAILLHQVSVPFVRTLHNWWGVAYVIVLVATPLILWMISLLRARKGAAHGC